MVSGFRGVRRGEEAGSSRQEAGNGDACLLTSLPASYSIGGLYDGTPVTASPMIRVWMSWVPS